MRTHRTVLTILQRVFVVIEDLSIFLSHVLAKHWNDLVSCLMIIGQQVHSKLVVNVLGDCLSLVMLLGRFDAKLVILDSYCHGRGPVFHWGHAFLA